MPMDFPEKSTISSNDNESARQMGMNGIALVRNKFSWGKIATGMISMYSSLITKTV